MLDLACIPDSLKGTVVVEMSAVSRYIPTAAKHSLAENKLVQVLHVKWCNKFFVDIHLHQYFGWVGPTGVFPLFSQFHITFRLLVDVSSRKFNTCWLLLNGGMYRDQHVYNFINHLVFSTINTLSTIWSQLSSLSYNPKMQEQLMVWLLQ